MTTSQPQSSPTPTAPTLPCALCGKPTAIIIGTRPICDDCVGRTDDADLRLWRASLKVIRGGLPL